MRIPAARMLLQAPDEPRSSRPIKIEGTAPTRFALRVLFGAKRFTFPAALLLSVHMVGEALVPLFVGLAIDQAIATGDAGRLLWWLAALAIDFLALSFAFRFGARIGLYGMQLVQHRLRTQVTDKLLHSQRDTHGESNGAALSIATSDVARLASIMQLGVYPVGEVASLVFASTALWLLSPALGIATAAGSAGLLAAILLLGGPLQRRSHEQQAAVADAAGQAADLLSGYRVLKGLGAEREAALRYRSVSRTALAGTLRAKSAHGWYEGTLQMLTGAFVAGIAVLAAMLALHGQLGIGGLIAAVGLVQFVAGPLNALPSHTGYVWATALASSARVLRVLRAEPNSLRAGRDAAGRESFSGTGSEAALQRTLPGTEIELRPSECVGVVASQATAGRLMQTLSQSVGDVLVVPHRAELFDSSILWNLETPTAHRKHFDSALHAAACDDIVAGLPDGINSTVGEAGTRLSGGQRQRIALARAYAAGAPTLVLHDPTSAVDSATEHLIAARLRAVRGDGCTVLITYSPALLAICDRVIRLDLA